MHAWGASSEPSESLCVRDVDTSVCQQSSACGRIRHARAVRVCAPHPSRRSTHAASTGEGRRSTPVLACAWGGGASLGAGGAVRTHAMSIQGRAHDKHTRPHAVCARRLACCMLVVGWVGGVCVGGVCGGGGVPLPPPQPPHLDRISPSRSRLLTPQLQPSGTHASECLRLVRMAVVAPVSERRAALTRYSLGTPAAGRCHGWHDRLAARGTLTERPPEGWDM